tara:strand:+ start:2307 stop:2978 length:672 start_codon:yes stop_codon:yes gene_type:complete
MSWPTNSSNFPVWPAFVGAPTIPYPPKCGPYEYTLDQSGNYLVPPNVDPSFCDGCCEVPATDVDQCTSLCQEPLSTQLLIQKQRRVSSSALMAEKAGLEVTGPQPSNAPTSATAGVNWYQGSDRNLPAGLNAPQRNNVPTRGNSTKTSITRLRPGSLAPGGIGVDAKHGSYARYLAKKRGGVTRALNASNNVVTQPSKGNKVQAFGMLSNIYGLNGKCSSLCS